MKKQRAMLGVYKHLQKAVDSGEAKSIPEAAKNFSKS